METHERRTAGRTLRRTPRRSRDVRKPFGRRSNCGNRMCCRTRDVRFSMGQLTRRVTSRGTSRGTVRFAERHGVRFGVRLANDAAYGFKKPPKPNDSTYESRTTPNGFRTARGTVFVGNSCLAPCDFKLQCAIGITVPDRNFKLQCALQF